MNLRNLKIGIRLAIGFGIVLLMLIVVAVFGLNRMHRLQNGIETITKVNDEKARLAVTMRASLNDRMIALRNIILLKEAAEIQPEVERVKNGTRKFDDAEAQLNKMLSSDASASEEEKSLMKKIRDEANAAAPIMAKVTELGLANKNEEATQVLIKELRPVQFRWMDAMMTMANLEEKMSKQAADEAAQTYETAFRLIVAISVAAILFGMTIAWFITRGITRPIEEAVVLARTVAAGNLTSRIDVTSSDETGQLLQALKEMNDSLARMVSQVRSGADMIATASGEIASGNLDLSSRTEEQASSLEETASSMEELTSTVKQNGENARQANQLAQSASGVAVKGGEVVSQVVDTMGSINESANRIVDIIAVIDGIAFQTNILALNAAVEAARAGEQGRGFAVVASEVRTLAQRSASAAKEIKELISDSVAKVEAGGKLVAEAGTTMDEIVGSVRRVSDIIAEIAAASREQEAGIEQINQAISEMDNVTQQNASLVEEASAASEALREQARGLSSMVSTFKLDSAQHAAPQATAPAKATVRQLPKAQFSANTVARRSASHKIANAASGNEWEEF